MLFSVAIDVRFGLSFDQDSLDHRLEKVQFLVEVIQFEWESHIGLLQARDLSLLAKFKPLDLQREHGHAAILTRHA